MNRRPASATVRAGVPARAVSRMAATASADAWASRRCSTVGGPTTAVRITGATYRRCCPVSSRNTVSPRLMVWPLNELWASPARYWPAATTGPQHTVSLPARYIASTIACAHGEIAHAGSDRGVASPDPTIRECRRVSHQGDLIRGLDQAGALDGSECVLDLRLGQRRLEPEEMRWGERRLSLLDTEARSVEALAAQLLRARR